VKGVDLPRLVRYMVRHPTVAPSLFRSLWRLRAQYWWRHAPFLPVPDPTYWEFRLTTATGSSDVMMNVSEVIAAAKWSSGQRVGR
jgi:hypothetical protein